MRAPILCALLPALVLATGTASVHAAESSPGLFLTVSQPATAATVERPRFELRHRAVSLDPALLVAARDGTAGSLRLNFFDDVTWDVAVTRVIRRAADGFTLIGHTADGEPGSFMLVREQGVVLINARSGEAAYQLRYRDGQQEVRQVDMAQFPPCGGGENCGECAPVPAPATPVTLATGDAPPVVAADSGAQFDVMVVYTPAARVAVGGTAAMNALITLAVDESNQAYANSGITPRLRLVHRTEVTYTEVDFSTDLDRLRGTSDGFMDSVHTLRNQVGADLVSLVINDTEYCGIGYLMTTLSPAFEANAFSVVYWDCATGYYSFAHELGHNMGCHHAVGDSGLTRSDPVLYPYAYGWRFNGTTWRTIMAYAPGTRIQHFSNPDVTYGGFATGVATGTANQAHNALVINNVASTVANWRQAITNTLVSLVVTSSFTAVSPPPGTWFYPVGSSVTCRATSSPAVQRDSQNQRTGICTGWVGTGSVPVSGNATSVTFVVTNNTTLAWSWQVTDWVVSNQTVAVNTNVTARDTVTAGTGYRVVSPGNVTLQAGQRVRLAPGFTATTGATFRARVGP